MAVIANAILIKFQGGWTGVSDIEESEPGQDHPYGRRVEASMTTNAVSQYQAQLDGTKQLILSVAEAVTVGLEPRGGDEPYFGFNLGDTVNITNSAGNGVVAREVWSITVDLDSEGELVYTPELNARKIEPLRAAYQRQKEMGNSSFQKPDPGDSSSPDLALAPFIDAEIAKELED